MSVKALLFENIGIRQTIFKNTFWLTLAETTTHFLNLAIVVYAARILGATEYGKFAFALSFVSLFVIFSDLGLSNITTREFSGEGEKEKEYPSILSLKIILSLGAFFIMFIGSFLITTDPTIRSIVWILTLFILISGFFNIIYAFLHSRQRMEYDAAAKILQIILIAGLGFFALFTNPSSINLSYAYLFANLISLILVMILFHYFFYPLKLEFNKNIWKRFLKISWPLSLGFIASWLYINIDSIMMGYLGHITEIGWYSAASKISLAIIISVSLISRSFYPVLSRFYKESKEKLQRIWEYQMKLMIILALPIIVGGLVLAPKIINLFYGEGYDSSILAFRILIFITGISFLYYPYGMILVVSNQQKRSFYLISIGAIINIILNLILIPKYSLYGAAVSTAIASIVILLLAIVMVKRFTPVSSQNLFGVSIMSVFSSLIMLAVIYLINTSIFIIIPISVAVYFAVLYLLQHGNILQHS